MVKPTGWVVDMRHYIDQNTGDLPEVIPERVLVLAIFFGAIVAWVTDHLPDGDEHTNVPCRRSPGRRRCRGDIIAQLDRPSGYIVWQCSYERIPNRTNSQAIKHFTSIRCSSMCLAK